MGTLEIVAYSAMIITPILLAGGIIFAYTQWRSAQNARMAEILLSITDRWDDSDMEESRCKINSLGGKLKEAIEQADKDNAPNMCSLIRIANFFDSLGALIVEGLLDCKMGYRLFGRAEEHYYQLYRPVIEDNKYSSYFKYFAELNALFKKEEAGQSKTKPRKGL